MSKLFRPRTFAFMLILVALAALTYGFAAGNTVNATKAGDGSTTVSGYTVDVTWTLNAANPSQTSSADLDFGADAPGTVYSRIGVSDTPGTGSCAAYTYGSWINCGSGSTPSCTYAGAVIDVCAIQVVATD